MANIKSDLLKAKEAMDKNDFVTANEISVSLLKENEGGTLSPSEIKDRLEILLTLSDICKNQDRLFDNINYLRELTKLARQANDREMQAKGIIRIGFVFNKMGKRDRAMKKFTEAEEITKDFENKVQYGYALAGKANIFWRTGDNKKAIDTSQEVLTIGLQNDEFVLTAGAANVMSSAWYEMGNFEEALKVAMLSVETYRNTKNQSDLARALNNQGEIYKRMKDYEKAIESYEEGISVLEDKTIKRYGYLLTNMAECQTRKGDLENARDNLKKARNFLSNSEDKYAIACMWYVKGLFEYADGKKENSIDWLRKAEKRMDELGVPYDLGIVRQDLVRQYLESGQKEQASLMANKAIEALEKAGASDLVDEVKELINS